MNWTCDLSAEVTGRTLYGLYSYIKTFQADQNSGRRQEAKDLILDILHAH